MADSLGSVHLDCLAVPARNTLCRWGTRGRSHPKFGQWPSHGVETTLETFPDTRLDVQASGAGKEARKVPVPVSGRLTGEDTAGAASQNCYQMASIVLITR